MITIKNEKEENKKKEEMLNLFKENFKELEANKWDNFTLIYDFIQKEDGWWNSFYKFNKIFSVEFYDWNRDITIHIFDGNYLKQIEEVANKINENSDISIIIKEK